MGSALDALLNGTSGSTSTGGKVYLGGQTGTPVVGPVLDESQRYPGVVSVSDAKKSFYSWSDAQLNSFKSKLSSYGFKNVSNVLAATMWETAVEGASTWYTNSGGKRKITPEDYIGWYAKSQGLGKSDEPIPTKSVYLYDKAQINDLVKKTVSNTLGRDASNDELTHFYSVIRDMIDEGTVSTTKKVNGVAVTTTKPGFSTEKAAAAIKAELKKSSPEDLNQKQSLDFADFLAKLEG